LITVTAFYVGRLGSVLAIIGKLQSFFMGPICALFTLGVVSKRANSVGVIIGGVVGLIATLIVANATSVSWLWWSVVGFVVSMLVGYLCSGGWLIMQGIKMQRMSEINPTIEGL
jgi:hypothetical protein